MPAGSTKEHRHICKAFSRCFKYCCWWPWWHRPIHHADACRAWRKTSYSHLPQRSFAPELADLLVDPLFTTTQATGLADWVQDLLSPANRSLRKIMRFIFLKYIHLHHPRPRRPLFRPLHPPRSLPLRRRRRYHRHHRPHGGANLPHRPRGLGSMVPR